jgi:hypothetical protein
MEWRGSEANKQIPITTKRMISLKQYNKQKERRTRVASMIAAAQHQRRVCVEKARAFECELVAAERDDSPGVADLVQCIGLARQEIGAFDGWLERLSREFALVRPRRYSM